MTERTLRPAHSMSTLRILKGASFSHSPAFVLVASHDKL